MDTALCRANPTSGFPRLRSYQFFRSSATHRPASLGRYSSSSGVHTLVQTPNAPPVQYPTRTEWDNITTWVNNNAGYVHPALRLVDIAECGSRGVIAIRPGISAEELQEAPLIAVPERLYMTNDDACKLLHQHQNKSHTVARPDLPKQWSWPFGSIRGMPAPAQHSSMPGPVQLALLLAHERAKGRDSFWWPYIEGLPAQPPCAWFGSNMATLAGELEALGPGTMQQLAQVKSQVEKDVDMAVKAYGKQLGCTEADVAWALAQVKSRAFGSDNALGLAPLIDLLNHRQGAPKPRPFEPDDEEDDTCAGSSMFASQTSDDRGPSSSGSSSGGGSSTSSSSRVLWYVTSMLHDEPQQMREGQELYISYIARTCSPFTALMNFGFIPPELGQRN